MEIKKIIYNKLIIWIMVTLLYMITSYILAVTFYNLGGASFEFVVSSITHYFILLGVYLILMMFFDLLWAKRNFIWILFFIILSIYLIITTYFL